MTGLAGYKLLIAVALFAQAALPGISPKICAGQNVLRKSKEAVLKCVSDASIKDVASTYKKMWGVGDKALIQWKLSRYFECESWSNQKMEPCALAKKIFGLDDDDSPYYDCLTSYNIHGFMKDSSFGSRDKSHKKNAKENFSRCKMFLNEMDIWRPEHKLGDDYVCGVLQKGYRSWYMPVCSIISSEYFYNHEDFEYDCRMMIYPDLKLCSQARTPDRRGLCFDGAAILDFSRDKKSKICKDNPVCSAVAGIKNECGKLKEEILSLYCEKKMEVGKACSDWCITDY